VGNGALADVLLADVVRASTRPALAGNRSSWDDAVGARNAYRYTNGGRR